MEIESFPSREQRMLIIKEGLTDQSQGVREACMEFLRPSMTADGVDENGAEKRVLISDLSYLFKLIDCKLLFVKEYYIQIPFIIMRFVFALAGESDLVVAQYLESLFTKLMASAGLEDLQMREEITFEEILFLRIAFEFSKLYRSDRSAEYIEQLEKLTPSFEDYSEIFQRLQSSASRLVFSEWVKYSLQLAIEDEVTRRNLVSLMFTYIG